MAADDKDYDVIPKNRHPADVESFGVQMEEQEEEIKLFQKKEVAALAVFAHFFGWRRTSAKGFVLAAPDGSKTISLPLNVGSLNAKVFRAQAMTITRHGIKATNEPLYQVVAALAEKAKLSHDHVRVMHQAADSYQGPAAVLEPDTFDADRIGSFYADLHPPSTPKPVTIKRQEPWTAHGRTRKDNGTETYPSDAVMEVTWSDGTVSYACRAEDCEYTSEYPRSVASHYASKHKRGEGKASQPEADGVDNDWTPTQTTRIRRLKRELDGALAAGLDITDTEAIAAWIITHRIEGLQGSDTEGGEGDTSVPAEPLTAEQILDKIAALADRGRAHILREQLDTLNSLLDASEAARTEETRRRQRAEGNLTALRDMLNETGE